MTTTGSRPPRSTKAQAAQHETFEAIIPGVSQQVNTSGTSAQSAALQPSTTLIRLFATNDCFIAWGENPTAAADGTCYFVPGGIVDFIGVPTGGTVKIAVIQSTNAGTLYISEAI